MKLLGRDSCKIPSEHTTVAVAVAVAVAVVVAVVVVVVISKLFFIDPYER